MKKMYKVFEVYKFDELTRGMVFYSETRTKHQRTCCNLQV